MEKSPPEEGASDLSFGPKKRLERARGLLNKLKSSGFPGQIFFFSDEKNFVVDPLHNPQNDRWICFYEDKDDKLRPRTTTRLRVDPEPPEAAPAMDDTLQDPNIRPLQCSWGR